MSSIKTDWYFIVNPHAGSGKTMGEWVPAEQKLDKLGITYQTAYTNHKTHATRLAYDAASEGYRKILAVGGDGSIHETFNGIMQWCDDNGCDPSDFILGVAPIGSGNDWIKSTGVPHDVMKVADMLEDSRCRGKMDIIKVTRGDGKPCYMANIGGLGFDSHVCKIVNLQKESGKRGKRIYLNALLDTIRTLDPIEYQVVADGEEKFSGLSYSLALGNGKYSGSGMRQVPLADMNDGLLDVMIVPKLPLFKLLPEIPSLFTGKIHECGKVIYFQCREVHIVPLNASAEDIFELDGEIEGRIPITVSVDPRRIGILCAAEE